MKHDIYLLLFIVVAGLSLASSCDKDDERIVPEAMSDPITIELRSEEKEMVESDQAFAFEFFDLILDDESGADDKNFMVSPLSLRMALAMTWNGAAGETERAIRETLKWGDLPDVEAVNAYYRKLKDALLKTDPSTRLSIANAIFTNREIVIKEDFIRNNRTYYDAVLQAVDFSDGATAGMINRWASDNTHRQIRKVIDKTNPDDLIYLLNAIYFKGVWASRFDADKTLKRPFTYGDGTRVNVDMMNQKSQFQYAEDEHLQLVALPYGNGAFSMIVLLPKEGKSLKDLMRATRQSRYWGNLLSGMQEREVNLYVPRFKTKYSKKLNDLLTDMGMGIAFTDDARFSGMSDHSAKIDFVRQDSYISTDETGTEAAAVTSVGMVLTAMPAETQPVIYNANKPFIYLIQENSTGTILFMGVVKNFD